MKWEMEIMSPSNSHVSSTAMSWSSGSDCKSSRSWTVAENKQFENALAIFDADTPDRWHKVASMIPGKTVGDVILQYKELEADVTSIEAGFIPVPGYHTSQFTLDWVDHNGLFNQSYGLVRKRSSGTRSPDHERKKGVPWTEEEHKLFLMGLKKYGKGDWRNISRNFVVTRTPTQVASHAQKYFIRQLSGAKDKRRASIHDITTVNLDDTRTPSPENDKSLLNPSFVVPRHAFNWNHCHYQQQQQQQQQQQHTSARATVVFNHPAAFGPKSYARVRLPEQKGAVNEPFNGSQNMIFQMQHGHCFPMDKF